MATRVNRFDAANEYEHVKDDKRLVRLVN